MPRFEIGSTKNTCWDGLEDGECRCVLMGCGYCDKRFYFGFLRKNDALFFEVPSKCVRCEHSLVPTQLFTMEQSEMFFRASLRTMPNVKLEVAS